MSGAYHHVAIGRKQMNAHIVQCSETRVSSGTRFISAPSSLVEYGFYFYMFYTLLGGLFGLSIRYAAGVFLIFLVIFCLRDVGPQRMAVIRVIAFPLGCAFTYILIQLVFHEESLTEVIQPFLLWMLTLILVQSLVLRKNFLHRFVLVMLFLGLIALPSLSVNTSVYKGQGEVQRAKLDRGIGFRHTNDMGAWYGFCALYLAVFAFTTSGGTLRIVSLFGAVVCTYVVTMTVSRGAVAAIAVGIVMAVRHLLKGGFLPILLLVALGAFVVELGVFDQSVQSYGVRGAEETGRLTVWPKVIDSFLDSPIIGVGDSNAGAMGSSHYVRPHNSFLYLAQSSGMVTLALFIAYCLRSGRAALRADVSSNSRDIAFYLPLLAFTFVTINLSGLVFMQFWAVVALALPMTERFRQKTLNKGTG